MALIWAKFPDPKKPAVMYIQVNLPVSPPLLGQVTCLQGCRSCRFTLMPNPLQDPYFAYFPTRKPPPGQTDRCDYCIPSKPRLSRIRVHRDDPSPRAEHRISDVTAIPLSSDTARHGTIFVSGLCNTVRLRAGAIGGGFRVRAWRGLGAYDIAILDLVRST
jgi:hypothetical protein